MIYVTGDIHGNPDRLGTRYFPEQKEMTKEDYVIILGDFGLVWDYKGENSNEKYWLDWLEQKPFTTLFIDGNHECHTRLNSYPVEEWNEGKVHKIRPSVIHLMRGQIFNLQNRKFFTFGGAASHDIDDGVIDPETDKNWQHTAKHWDLLGKIYRIKGVSWWSEELPSKQEMIKGRVSLTKVGNKVDFILTHSPPASIIAALSMGTYDQDCLTKYLEEINQNVEFKKWLCGHMHVDMNYDNNHTLLYQQILNI